MLICGWSGLPWPGSPQNSQIKVSLGLKSMCRGVLALWPPSAAILQGLAGQGRGFTHRLPRTSCVIRGGNRNRCSVKILSSCPNCQALLVVALAMRSSLACPLQSEFEERGAEPALLCGTWKD